MSAPHTCDFVRQYLRDTLGLTQQRLEPSGYTSQTTLDLDLQRSGDAAVLQTLPMGDLLAACSPRSSPAPGTCW